MVPASLISSGIFGSEYLFWSDVSLTITCHNDYVLKPLSALRSFPEALRERPACGPASPPSQQASGTMQAT